MVIVLCHCQAQQSSGMKGLTLPSEFSNSSTTTPFYFEKEDPVGSSYLSKNWMRGNVEFSNHTRIPTQEQNLYFNFDKLHNVLFVLYDLKKLKAYPIDSISNFTLMGNEKDYSFEKVSWISNNFYLMPVIKSEKGYSLYKRLITKIMVADYQNQGYYSTGKKFDEYTDTYEYYIVYPGNKTFRKSYLKENNIRRLLKDESGLIDEFFSLHDNEITEQSLLGIIQFIDDKKYPEL
jgi:hypothetical protein